MRVFLSYHTPDFERAKALRAAILRRQSGWDIFFAPYDITLGAFWIDKLGQAIDDCDAFLILVGERVGPWQQLEYFEALRRRLDPKRPISIAPVLIGKTAPGLPFLHQFSRIVLEDPDDADTIRKISEQLAGEHAAGAAQAASWRLTNPYRGLHAMREDDAAFFFGREPISATVLDNIAKGRRRVQTLVGNSGVGKSSIALAGVLGALHRQMWPGAETTKGWPRTLADSKAWLCLTMRPGERPLENLAFQFCKQWMDPVAAETRREAKAWAQLLAEGEGLGGLLHAAEEHYARRNLPSPRRFVLHIDQGEELYARTGEEDSGRRRFSEVVAEAAAEGKIAALASMRSDYYGELQNDAALLAACDMIDVPPLARAALGEVITKPPALLGAGFADAKLAERITEKAAAQPGALPLLSYLMEDIWTEMQRREEPLLRLESRDFELGDALVQRAEAFLDAHREQEHTIRRLFCVRLIHTPNFGDPVRRRALKADLSAEEAALADDLADAERRLLVLGQSSDGQATVEVAHEALIRDWKTLQRWVEADRAFQVWKGEIEIQRRRWEDETDTTRRVAGLLYGLALSTAEGWLRTRREDTPARDIAFIEASLDAKRKGKVEAERQRQAHEKALRARVRWQRMALAAAAIVVLLSGASVWYVASIARKLAATNDMLEQTSAEARSLLRATQITESQFLADLAQQHIRKGDAGTALALALAALPKFWPVNERPLVIESEAGLRQSLLDLREQLVLAHDDIVLSASFSPDGTRIVTASADKTARIWDAVSGKVIAVLQGHDGVIYSAAFSPDGTRIVTGSEDKTIRLWDAASGKQLATLKGHEDRVLSAAFSSDGRRVVSASSDKAARLWDTASDKPSAVLSGHDDTVWFAGFSPDGTRILTASTDKTARVWDAMLGTQLVVLRGHEARVMSAAFSPDGTRIVTASLDKTGRLWDASGNQLAVLGGHGDSVVSASFSRDGTRIVTGSLDRTARLWDASGKMLAVLGGHEESVISAAFSPDGKRVVTASSDRTARLWDAASGKLLAVLAGHDNWVKAAFSPDGARVVTASGDKTARVWSAASAAPLAVIEGQANSFISAAFGPDGVRIVAGSGDKTARIWDSSSRKLLAPLVGHESIVTSATFSPDGERVLTSSDDRTARLWHVTSGQLLATLTGHEKAVRSAAFSRDGTRIVTASWDKTARVWDTSGNSLSLLTGHEHFVISAAFSADGARVVTASWDKTARIWDTASGKQLRVIAGHKVGVISAAFSPDGTLIVTASEDRIGRLWEAASGKLIAVLVGHEHFLTSADFNPDGTRIVTTSEDNTARVWDAASGKQLAVLSGHENWVYSATFSADGARILTASRDNTVRVWRWFSKLEDALTHARAVMPRQLTPEQRVRFFLDAAGRTR